MGKSVKSPPSPDPNVVASAQTGSNLTTAIGNTWLGNANYTSPWGTTKTRQQTRQVAMKDAAGKTIIDKKTGKPRMKSEAVYKTVTDPTSGRSYKVPVFEHEMRLSRDQQKLLDQQENIGFGLNDMALDQTKRLRDHLGKPLDLNGLQEVKDFEGYRKEVEDKLMTRLNEDFDKDYAKMETRLINQGAARGSRAFSSAETQHGRNVNDARVQAFLASGAEARNAGGYDMNLRNQQLAERLTMRNQPINEVTALLSGGQVNVPQMPGFQGASMGETPIGQYMYQNWSQNNQRAQQNAQANAQMWSNIGNIGAGLFRWSSRRLKKNIELVFMDKRGFGWYAYDYIWGGPRQFGVIAEEVSSIVPGSTRSIDGFLAVDYGVIGNADPEAP